MKRLFFITRLLIFVLFLASCSSTDEAEEPVISGFAMTAKINGDSFEANNPFGSNEFSETNIFARYPIEDFVLLQARMGGAFGGKEINLWLKREDIIVGSYNVFYKHLGLTPPTHYIQYIDNTNDIYEQTLEGVIKITEVDNLMKTVKGNFEFTTVNDDESAPVDFTITDGEFNYKYE